MYRFTRPFRLRALVAAVPLAAAAMAVPAAASGASRTPATEDPVATAERLNQTLPTDTAVDIFPAVVLLIGVGVLFAYRLDDESMTEIENELIARRSEQFLPS